MKKQVLDRLIELKEEVKNLPKELLSEKNFEDLTNSNSEEDKAHVYNDISKIKEQKSKIFRKILGFFSTHLEDNSIYYQHLNKLTFSPKEGIFNTTHYKNNEAWLNDRKGLLNLLEILENELNEKMNLPKEKKDSIFLSGLFWTILPLAVALAYFLGSYKAEYDKSDLEKKLQENKTQVNEMNDKIEILKRQNDSLKKLKIINEFNK
ncbi:hypothetical protein G1K97_13535 [Tenacibaculum finnmarkense]|uniref:hypothetical protein n=1 Tax=Tenacibaculum finnmarkense TaxID=2781243 RepID=UPI001EFBD7CC|nr:hypothetical protein [Tenacibaculum finnmarkense]MCG8902851.1 hypothetical protein [Tenacibaculum finnmarkense]